MKVLAAYVASWLLVLFGSWFYRAGCRLIAWSDRVEDWAGIGPDEMPEGIWIKADYMNKKDTDGGL